MTNKLNYSFGHVCVRPHYLQVIPLPVARLHKQNGLNEFSHLFWEAPALGAATWWGDPQAMALAHGTPWWGQHKRQTFHGRTTLWQVFCSFSERWRKARMSWIWIGCRWMPQLTVDTRGIQDINHDLGHFWDCPKTPPVPLTCRRDGNVMWLIYCLLCGKQAMGQVRHAAKHIGKNHYQFPVLGGPSLQSSLWSLWAVAVSTSPRWQGCSYEPLCRHAILLQQFEYRFVEENSSQDMWDSMHAYMFKQ